MDKIKCFESPFGMFELTKEVFFRYYENVSEADFILLIFLLNHLREQIVEGQKFKDINKISPSERTDGQNFFVRLFDTTAFTIINELCNGSKHHKIDKQLQEVEGFRCGLSRCSDRLGQRYFLIDGEDSRNIFSAVFDEYRSFFEEKTIKNELHRIANAPTKAES